MAPEKIYIRPLLTEDGNYIRRRVRLQKEDNSIEYVRKDAFIEKACEWLNDNLHHYWGSISADPHNFLFDFRKAMEE